MPRKYNPYAYDGEWPCCRHCEQDLDVLSAMRGYTLCEECGPKFIHDAVNELQMAMADAEYEARKARERAAA